MAAITSIETDEPVVVILVAAHNAAVAYTQSGDVTAYLRAFRRIYQSMTKLVGVEEEEDEEEEDD